MVYLDKNASYQSVRMLNLNEDVSVGVVFCVIPANCAQLRSH